MSFDPDQFGPVQPGQKISEDPFREVELQVIVRRLSCPRCRSTAIYRYHVQQVRRKPEIQFEDGREVREDHRQIWGAIPRFAEIPETVKCKYCGDVIGLDTSCIF